MGDFKRQEKPLYDKQNLQYPERSAVFEDESAFSVGRGDGSMRSEEHDHAAERGGEEAEAGEEEGLWVVQAVLPMLTRDKALHYSYYN